MVAAFANRDLAASGRSCSNRAKRFERQVFQKAVIDALLERTRRTDPNASFAPRINHKFAKGGNDEKGVENPAQLTLAEMRALDSVLYTHTLYRWWNSFRLYEEGLLEAEAWQSAINADLGLYYYTPYGRAWWSEIQKQLWVSSDLPQELIEYIDSRLDRLDTATHRGPADFYEKVKAATLRNAAER